MTLNCMIDCCMSAWTVYLSECLDCARFTVAGENRLGIWCFRLSEQLSPERKHQKLIPCFCARSRLGEPVWLERESLSSKRDSLAWARIRPEFGLFSVSSLAQVPRSGENDSPKRKSPFAWARPSSLGENLCSWMLFLCF